MESLVWNKEVSAKYYETFSILFDEEYSGMFLMLLENLKTVKFNLLMKDTNLDMPDYWSFVIPAEISTTVQQSPKVFEKPVKRITEPIRAKRVKKKPSQRRNVRVSESPKGESIQSSYESYRGEGMSDSVRSDMISDSLRSEDPSFKEEHSLSQRSTQSSFKEGIHQGSIPRMGSLGRTKEEELALQRSMEEQKEQSKQKRLSVSSKNNSSDSLDSIQLELEDGNKEDNEVVVTQENPVPIEQVEPIPEKAEPVVTESKPEFKGRVFPSEIPVRRVDEEEGKVAVMDEPVQQDSFQDKEQSPPIDELELIPEEDILEEPDATLELEDVIEPPREMIQPPQEIIVNMKPSLSSESILGLSKQMSSSSLASSQHAIPLMSLGDLNDRLNEIYCSNDYKSMVKDLHQSVSALRKHGGLIQSLDDCVDMLCCIETILKDGVKKGALLRQWTFLSEETVDKAAAMWACFSRLREVLPEGAVLVDEIKRKPLSTPQGLARAFIHASLNRKELKTHVEALLKMEERISEIYNDAFIKNKEIVEVFLYYLDILSLFDFRLSTDDKSFDDIDFYFHKRKAWLANTHEDIENSYQPASFLEKRFNENSYKSQMSIQTPLESGFFGYSSSLEPNTPVISETPISKPSLKDSYNQFQSPDQTFYMSPTTDRKRPEYSPESVKESVIEPQSPVFSPESVSDSSFNVFGKSLLTQQQPRERYNDRISTTHFQSNFSTYGKQNRTQTMQRFAPPSDDASRRQTISMGRKTPGMANFLVKEKVEVDAMLPGNILKHNIIKEYVSPNSYSRIKVLDEVSRKDIHVVKPSDISDIEAHKTIYQDAKSHDFFLLEDQKKKPFSKKLAICPDCGTDIEQGEARWCTYTGSYYCDECHLNNGCIIPSRIIFHWDFKQYKVSEYARTHIQNNMILPVIDLQEVMSRSDIKGEYWYLSAPAPIGKLHSLREKIVRISQFLRTCRNSQTHLSKINERKHFAWSSSVWALKDFVDLKDGKLRAELEEVEELFRNHVLRCEICKGKGFFCEVCTKRDLLFPFSDGVSKCKLCKAIFHGSCFKESITECPKCKRKEKVKSKGESGSSIPKTISA